MNGLRSTKTARFFQRRAWPVAALLACLSPLGAQAQTVTYEKTEQIVYENNKTAWVIGQVKSVTCLTSIPSSTQSCNGHVVSETSYDAATALPLQTKAFGKIQQTLTYNLTTGTQDGTLSTVKDGNNNITTLSNWMRGIPQTITHPATTDQPTPVTESAVVNNDGTIASVTDENGFVTQYQYDAMGRLSLIDYPDGDTVAWNSTTRDFAFKPGIYGLPSHWRLSEYTGNGFKVTRYDALWRPVVEESFANGDSTSYSFVVKRYDDAGRLVFQSYPLASLTNYADTTLKGTTYTYDALDRTLTVAQNSELGPLTTTTEYLSGFQTRVTNPRGYQTAIQYQAYDQPSTEAPVGVTRYAPTSTNATEIARDPHGKPLTIKRRNADDTLSATRSYTYNSNQELCRTDEPETGVTAMGYDAAGNLSWSAAGYAATGAECLSSATVAARRADRTYDARNRLKTLSFPNGLGNTTSTYTPDSLLASITADNGGTSQVTTNYTYNRRRLPTNEQMLYGSINWSLGHTYNANGHLASDTYPGPLTVDYAPDALGRPTQAGTFASGVSYFPNGAIQQFTYGNGITHTLTQNVRQLPDTSCDSYGACGASAVLNDGYDYDRNGNVAAISDGRTGNHGDRSMVYDALDRLISTSAPMMFGTANYSYDVLDNLTRTQVTEGNPSRDHYYCYNPQWQLAFVRKGPVCTGANASDPFWALEYDPQGNLKDRNSTVYAFDYGNRLRGVNSPSSSYAYDGHGRRFLDSTTASKYSFYAQSGQLGFVKDHRTNTYTNYVYLGGSLIATREWPVGGGTVTTQYQHTDALGSPVVVTDANRQEVERTDYEPYGKPMRAGRDGPGYTGHVEDAATGLVQMQQRYYDPLLGRFLSVDPVTADGNTGDNFNRYKYAANNPYSFKDPDGRQECRSCEIGYGASVGLMMGDDEEKMRVWAGGEAAATTAGSGAEEGAVLGQAIGDFIENPEISGPRITQLAAVIVVAKITHSKVQRSVRTERVGRFTKTTEVRPGKGSGQSRAEYVRVKNENGKTIKTYKDSYDRAGKFQHRKPLTGGPEGRPVPPPPPKKPEGT
ncbi:RHS repeat-associated core domain-containing protein [Lysobacter sp. M2-1]|uniref:RHS repeat domain-containing protein n=1 Tax=Lysobacter sp. M2-1 TaxID=2916839 RepID=UPI001F5AAA6D|nr:RHS repeat-associated core domain-containing protein [Lysobacter sp. M2-1]